MNQRLGTWRLGRTLVVLVIASVGCGESGPADGELGGDIGELRIDSSTGDVAPAVGSASVPVGVEDSGTPERGGGAAWIGDAPSSAAEAHPSDAYFALERVMDIDIKIAEEDWDELRHQDWTEELRAARNQAAREPYGWLRPFGKIYTWFPAAVTVDGETHSDVGVRKKGAGTSLSFTKPSLKLRFDRYVDGQSLGGVMERMTLNNSLVDRSKLNTCLSYRVFAAGGTPAPRCNFATVSVNGEELGLYVHVEEIKAPFFLSRHFQNTQGNLYEGEGVVSDFMPERRGKIEKDSNEDAADWSDVDAVVEALQDPSDAGLEALGEIVDLDRFLSFWATEVLLGRFDSYSSNGNNFQFYREPGGLFVFMPWGPDEAFDLQRFDDLEASARRPVSVIAYTAIPRRLYADSEWRARYVDRMKELLDTVWDEEELLAAADEMAVIVQHHDLLDAAARAAADTERVREFIQKRRDQLLAELPSRDNTSTPTTKVKLPSRDNTSTPTTKVKLPSRDNTSTPTTKVKLPSRDNTSTPKVGAVVINEIAAKGNPQDWFELANLLPDAVALDDFMIADSLADAGKRIAFPPGTTIQPGEYMQFDLDKVGWPGFALGGDEELGIWLSDGTLVDSVDWNEGQSPGGKSYARMPDIIGGFQTVDNPTPGTANQ